VKTGINKKRVLLFISAFIVVSTLMAYEPMRHNDFVSYDDPKYITENPDIKAGITWESFWQSFTQPHYYMWHPLTTLSHKLDCQLFGLNPFAHHFVSLLFHISNALLLFWILTNITGATWPSAFVAAVFALHPLQVESVAWAAERKTVLSGLFWLLTIAVYIHYTRRPGISRYILLLAVFGLCIMTKPVVVTLPFVLLLLDYWPLEQVRLGHNAENKNPAKSFSGLQKIPVGRLIAEKIPLFVMSGILGLMTFAAQRGGGAVVTLDRIPLDYRIANAFLSYTNYIGKMIWPSRLAVFYPHPNANFSKDTLAISVLLFLLMLVFSIYIGRRKKYIAVGWLWYVVALVPVIGLVQSGSQAMANRYMYIPMVGLLIIVAWGVKDIVANKRHLQIVAAVSAAVVLSIAVTFTRMQVRNWQNSLTLFDYALKTTENNTIAENSYGCALYDEGRVDEAIEHLKKAVHISPIYFDAHNNLGKAFIKQKRPNEAIACFNELLQKSDKSAEVHYYLALALGMQKRYDDAIRHFARALELDPQYPKAHEKMGIALLAAGKPNEAIEHLKEGLQTTENQADVYANLGVAYIKLGKYEEAIQNLTKAVESKPDSIDALNNLAWLLATGGDITGEDANQAIGFAERACELTMHKEPKLLDTLAAAYAAAGRYEEAVKTAKQAVDMAKAGGLEDQVIEIQSRMELYKTGKRYLQK
jgi:tetratricopeptide (TPR) repeat protein